MTKRFLSCFIAIIACLTPAHSQKQLKSLRAYVKAKNTGEAMKEVQRLEADSTCRLLPELYGLAVEAQVLINNVENEKVYLKKACDTTKLFNSSLQIFQYALKCDSVERYLHQHKGKKIKLRKKHSELLRMHYPNLNMGARYFYSKENYKAAQEFLAVCIDMAREPMWADSPIDSTHKEYLSNIYRYTYAAFANNDFANVERYKQKMLSIPEYSRFALEMFARSAEAEGKRDKFEAYLVDGIKKYLLHPYFFDELANVYLTDKRYEEVITLADSLYQIDSTSNKALHLKALSLYELKRKPECLEVSKTLTQRDTTLLYPEVNYYVGNLMMQEIDTITIPTNMFSPDFKKNKSRIKSICAQSRPYLERFRVLCPEESDKWAPLLYKIYLELNLGKEFEDICKIYQ